MFLKYMTYETFPHTEKEAVQVSKEQIETRVESKGFDKVSFCKDVFQ